MIQSSDAENKKAAALALAEEHGWQVAPCWWAADGSCGCGDPNCHSPGKHPIGQLAPRGLKSATTDLSVIADWWDKQPRANIAVRTGTKFWALDCDGADGKKAFCDLCDLNEEYGETVSQFTGGGGMQEFFRPIKGLRNRTKINGLSIDVRGEDGYVIVPPSEHVSGSRYAWEFPPDRYKLAEAPTWLVEFVRNGTGAKVVNSESPGMKFEFLGDLATHPGAEEGKRNDTLCRLVGDHLATKGIDNDLLPLAIAWGRRCKPPYEDKEVQRTVQALVEKHAKEMPTGKASSSLVLQGYGGIEAEEVTWLWQDRIAMGKLTIISGDPGLGKSYLSLFVSSVVSRGGTFPDGARCQQGDVIVATCEDGPADTIRPRLDLLGADVDHVYHLAGVQVGEKLYLLQIDKHLDTLRKGLDAHPGVRLLVIDPISAFLGETDSHNNAEVRAVLGPLATLAEEYDVAVVGINHLNKAQGKALYRSMGSLAFVAAARAAWAVMADPDDHDRRLFLPVKNNLAAPSGLAFRIEDKRILFEDAPVLISVDDLDTDDDTPREEAKAWLQAMLAAEPIAASKIFKQAKADGISDKTLKRAKKELRIKSVQFAGGWVWALPDEEDTDGKTTYTF